MSTRPIGGEPPATWMLYIEELEVETKLARELIEVYKEWQHITTCSIPAALRLRLVGAEAEYHMLLSQKEADE